jgi:hypothetical protein
MMHASEAVVGSILSTITEESVGRYVLRVAGIDLATFAKKEIAEFRRGRRSSGAELLFYARGVADGEVIAESKEVLENFSHHLRNNRGFLMRDDL